MYNILSFGLGLFAWGFGGAAAVRGKFGWPSYASLPLCGISLTVQFYELRRLVDKGDWSAIEDIIGALSFVAATRLIVTLALNTIALMRKK